MYGGNEIHIHKKNLVKVLKTFLLCLSYSDKLWSFEKCDEVHFPVKYTERQTGEDGWRTLWLINNYLLGILENWEEYWGLTGETDAKIKQKLTLKWRLLGFLAVNMNKSLHWRYFAGYWEFQYYSSGMRYHEWILCWLKWSLMLALIELQPAGTISRCSPDKNTDCVQSLFVWKSL